MRSSFKIHEVCDENFSAPNVAVSAVTGAVEREADHIAVEMVFSHAGGDVRMMMLDSDRLQPCLSPRPLGRKIIGMQIVGDDRGFNFQNVLQVIDRFLE